MQMQTGSKNAWMDVVFWGVRGSVPCPGRSFARYGGNTSCVELRAGGTTVIFDAGTGIRALGRSLHRRGAREAHLFLSHAHWDHICGFPFFNLAYDPGFTLHVRGGRNDHGGVRDALSGQMTRPLFPVALDNLRATLRFDDLAAGSALSLPGDLRVTTAALNHPDGATAYRVEHRGLAACYVTDVEHTPGALDPAVLALIHRADLVIYDCTYEDHELDAHRGWGHSTWQQGVRLCRAAGARRLAIFHHDPDRRDDRLDDLARRARATWRGAFVAREGRRLTLRSPSHLAAEIQ